MVVDVCLVLVLPLHVLMGLMRVLYRRMVVLVAVL